VEVSGDDPQAVQEAAARFAPQPSNGHAVAAPAQTEEVLNPAEIEQLWKTVQPEAQRVLALAAQRPEPEGMPFDEVQAALGLPNGQALSGRTSSIGHAMRRLFPGRPEPLPRNWTLRRYEMHPQVAAAIRRLANGNR
jgi:hypothetical protein